jgi:poly-beta-1,6-N-acetyl-D-glucosamine biosynthesis protein PgaD
MWILYLYLIREVFTDALLLFDETFGWVFHHAPLPGVPKVMRFLYILGLYMIVVIVNGFILVGWATYNRLRFRGSDNRRAIAIVNVDELGRFYGFSGEKIAEWQKAGSIVMVHDAEGNLISAVTDSVVLTGGKLGHQPVSAVKRELRDEAPGNCVVSNAEDVKIR